MADVHSRYINGNLAFWDTHRNRIVGAIGPMVAEFVEDFIGKYLPAADSLAAWTVTLVELGAGESTAALEDGAGGIVVLTADANEDDGVQMQLTNEAFKLVSGKPLYFGCRWKVSESIQSDILVGLAITDTTLLASAPSDGVYVRKDDGDQHLDFVTNKNSTLTTTTVAGGLADDTYVITEFFFDGTNVYFYLNGVEVGRHATNVVDDEEITPSIAFLSGAAGAGKALRVDWVRTYQFNS